MKTTERFTNAVTKLYNAFHNGTLNAFNCKMCAIGSMCDGSDTWADLWQTDTGEGSLRQRFFFAKEHNYATKKTGYSVKELAAIELVFLRKFDLSINRNGNDKEQQFAGLCAVVEYLCELDGIPNVMDYTCLFETENNAPKHELKLVNV